MKYEFKIFEIPVYYTTEENHNKKWKDAEEKYISHQLSIGATKSEAHSSFIKSYKYESTWNYHKIIGFIELKYDNRCGELKYYVYQTINKKNQYNQIFKLKFDNRYGPNLHDYVRNKKNKDILEIIENRIKYIEKEKFHEKCYIDLRSYYVICKYIDFEKMIKDFDD